MGESISVHDLGIKFHINQRGRRRKGRQLTQVFVPRKFETVQREFWALRNVSLTIQQGEAVGIIGRNGSGKSTLLRLIAGVLLPDEGRVQVNGGVGAMLELSAGFVGSLTARDNVYLLSALHGFSREQVDERFDEIIRWAEVERFVDSQIRHFSSGMRARLAFSVVTRLEEPILLIDEVLAVGDKAFRRKCSRVIEGMMSEGRTMLLVSHNEGDLERLCTRGIYLKAGEVVADGPIRDVLDLYATDSDREQ
ncbi:MAG: type transport system ATP-binding protein [Frankiaceae bacterium]|nr:type transport system ATP-binding protein [Frankiaceae bacterium]